jgi:hypothetical protein
MSTRKLSNITIAQFQSFLELCKASHIRTKGGHEIWSRADLNRSIVIQTHIDPIPERIIRNNLRTIGYSRKEFFEIMDQTKVVVRASHDVFELKLATK